MNTQLSVTIILLTNLMSLCLDTKGNKMSCLSTDYLMDKKETESVNNRGGHILVHVVTIRWNPPYSITEKAVC